MVQLDVQPHDFYDITERMLKVAFNTKTQTTIFNLKTSIQFYFRYSFLNLSFILSFYSLWFINLFHFLFSFYFIIFFIIIYFLFVCYYYYYYCFFCFFLLNGKCRMYVCYSLPWFKWSASIPPVLLFFCDNHLWRHRQ